MRREKPVYHRIPVGAQSKVTESDARREQLPPAGPGRWDNDLKKSISAPRLIIPQIYAQILTKQIKLRFFIAIAHIYGKNDVFG